MDDFKLNAERIIAAQKAKTQRAQSPETESNWDSSDPEDNTATQVSSDEEFSVQSTRSQKSVKSNKSSKPVAKPETSKNRTPSKPEPTTPGKKSSQPANEPLSGKKGTGKPGINVFVDRGNFDSDDQLERSTAKKTRRKKNENPPYDFRNAIKDEDNDPPSANSAQRPGRSKKGNSYDPAPAKSKRNPKPKSDEQFRGAGSWDDSDENEKALERMRMERDGEVPNNNNRSAEVEENKHVTAAQDGEEEGEKTKKKKGWNISLKKKKTERREEVGKEVKVAMTTPLPHDVKPSEVALVARKGDEDKEDFAETIVSLDTQDRGLRYVYIYHHGNTSHHDTRRAQEEVFMTVIANKSERIVRRCAQEVFATLRIIVDLFLIFLLEGLRFITFNIISALLVGLATGFGDFFLKPLATALFNGLCQPIAMFFFNVGVMTRTATRPFIDVFHNVLAEIAMVIRAFRLVEINRTSERRNSVEDV